MDKGNNMTKWSVTHKTILFLFVFLLIGFGAYGFSILEMQENPTVVSPACVVKVVYPGASPEDVEKQVIKILEKEINTIEGIKTIEGFALDSIGIVKIVYKDMSDDDILRTNDKVKEQVDIAKPKLPANAWEPVIETDFTSPYGLILALYSDEHTYETLETEASLLEDALKRNKQVKAVDIEGKVRQQVFVDLHLEQLSEYGLAISNIPQLIQARNINIPSGNLERGGMKVPVNVTGEYQFPDELGQTIIAVSEKGSPVYLKNIASVYQGEEKKEKTTFYNGHKALLVGVKYMEGVNITLVEQDLQKIVQEFEAQSLYTDVGLAQVYNQADFVRDSINLFADNLISAIILLVIVVCLFMGLRSAAIVSIPIPLVICVSFVYMYIAGIPIHQVSIASMIISLSLLVANGIVSNDNIHVYLEQGHDLDTACVQGVQEVKIPILTSTLTTVASFLPLAMMQGPAGKFVYSLPILVSVALFASYFASLTVVPAMAHLLLKAKHNTRPKKTHTPAALQQTFSTFSTRFLQTYSTALTWCLHNSRKVLAVALAAFLLSLLIIPTMLVQVFPPVERQQYVLNLTVQDGSTHGTTEQVAHQVADMLLLEESIQDFAYSVGIGFMKYYITFFPTDQATNKAQFLVNGLKSEAPAIEKRLQQAIPGILISIKELEISMPLDYPIQIRITGDDLKQIRMIADDMHSILTGMEGIKNMEDNFGHDTYKLQIHVQEEKANLLGISNYEIATLVRLAVNGIKVSELKQKDIRKDAQDIVLRVADTNDTTMENIFITSSITGKNIYLTQIADLETQPTLGKIVHRSGKRTITLGINLYENYNTLQVLDTIQKKLADYSLPEGYSIEYGGENENNRDTFSSLPLPTVIAIILIYLVLVFQFGNLKEPLIIIATIPLSFIGIIIGLKLMGYPIGFMALLGAISLMGVVVNNGIVLLDYMKIRLAQYSQGSSSIDSAGAGDAPVLSPLEIIVQACSIRLRPIMIGMITTVISLLPLMLSGGALWAPLATSIVFGMLLSSLLTLLVIPCCYCLVNRIRL